MLLGAQITWSPRQQATTFTPRFNSSSTRVTGLHPKKVKQASKLYPAGTVTRRLVYDRQPCSIGNKGGTLHRSLFGPKPVDSASKGAFSDILHTNPHLVGRSHPVSVEVREFDWDSSRKGASQLPRTKTIRLSTPKTTTGENLMLGYTSPLICWLNIQSYTWQYGGKYTPAHTCSLRCRLLSYSGTEISFSPPPPSVSEWCLVHAWLAVSDIAGWYIR